MQSNAHSNQAHLAIPRNGAPVLDLRTLPVPEKTNSPDETSRMMEARSLADVLGAQLVIAPQFGQAELRWPQGGINSAHLRDELYLRTGVLLDTPSPEQANTGSRLPLRTGLPASAYQEAASRIQQHGFYFWQRNQVPGVL